MAGSQDDLIAKLTERYRALCKEHGNAQENIERMQAHQRELIAQINDCLAAARVFGCDLGVKDDAAAPYDALRQAKPFHTPSAHPRQKTVTIRGLVLAAVEKAYPNPIRASDIHRQIVERGFHIHEKTVGMTLYRWSLEDRVRHNGKLDWLFVPPARRSSNGIDTDHNGKTPMLELTAPLAL